MTQLTPRRLEGEEMLEVVYPLTTYALHPSPPLPDVDEWKAQVGSRRGVTCYVAFAGNVSVACAVSTAMTQNVRGALLGMGGIWGVATRPGDPWSLGGLLAPDVNRPGQDRRTPPGLSGRLTLRILGLMPDQYAVTRVSGFPLPFRAAVFPRDEFRLDASDGLL